MAPCAFVGESEQCNTSRSHSSCRCRCGAEDRDLADDARRLSANLRAQGAADGATQQGPFQGPFRGTYLWRPLARGDERRPPSLHPLGWNREDARDAVAEGEGAGKDIARQETCQAEESEQHSWFLQLTAALGIEDIVGGAIKPGVRDGNALSGDEGASGHAGGRIGETCTREEPEVEEAAGTRQEELQRSCRATAQERDLQQPKEKKENAKHPKEADITFSPHEESNPAERAAVLSALHESLTNSFCSAASFGSSDVSCFEADASILSHASTMSRDQADVDEGVSLCSEASARLVEDEKEQEDRRENDRLRDKIEALEKELRKSREGSREREREGGGREDCSKQQLRRWKTDAALRDRSEEGWEAGGKRVMT